MPPPTHLHFLISLSVCLSSPLADDGRQSSSAVATHREASMTTRTTLNKRMRLIEAAGGSTSTVAPLPLSPLALSGSGPASSARHVVLPFASGAKSTFTTPSTTTCNQTINTRPSEDDFMDTSFFEASHPHTIIHIDIDCFYAQVEELRDPSLRDVPLGIQQKNCLVTCNYKARAKGVKKLMSVQEAQQLCPELVLVRGEDLTPYRQMSSRVFEHITREYPQLSVERLGMDENFVDVTKLVDQRVRESRGEGEAESIVGCIYPAADVFTTNCLCGCQKRLTIGTHIAAELRASLEKELGIKTCAGIAHNKMLAKLAGALNKPNNQTVVVPTRCRDLMVELKELRSIPGEWQTDSWMVEKCDKQK